MMEKSNAMRQPVFFSGVFPHYILIPLKYSLPPTVVEDWYNENSIPWQEA